MTEQLLERIASLTSFVLDETLSPMDRVAAADEVLMWSGPLLTREALSRHISYSAGCLHDSDGNCQCDEWQALAELATGNGGIWPDAMDWSPE